MFKFKENEEEKVLKEYELYIDENSIDTIDAMGWVDYPAIEQNLYYFNKKRNNYTFSKINEEKGIIVAPAMIPEKRIYRYDPYTNEEYNVFFSKETVRRASELFLIRGKHINNTINHIYPVDGLYLIHTWIVENQYDPIITKYNYENIPDGTWVLSYKIENEDVKDKIKNGEINGLSIEAWLSERLIDDNMEKIREELKNNIRDILVKME